MVFLQLSQEGRGKKEKGKEEEKEEKVRRREKKAKKSQEPETPTIRNQKKPDKKDPVSVKIPGNFQMAARTGFEPVNAALRGLWLQPLAERAMCHQIYHRMDPKSSQYIGLAINLYAIFKEKWGNQR